jgi:hypothetical protein
VTSTTTTTTTTTVVTSGATGSALSVDDFETFQAFVKGLEANARDQAARNAVTLAASTRARTERPVTPSGVGAGPPSGAVGGGVAAAAPAPVFLPSGPLFNDTPAPLLPLGASGLRSARSFVLLFGLSAVALVFLAFRARLARRHARFGTATFDDRGDYVDFV